MIRLFFFLLLHLFSVLLFAQQPEQVVSVSEPFYIPVTRTVFYKLGDHNIPVSISAYGNDQRIVYINLHDDENSSVSAARKILQKKGGLLIGIMNNGQRLLRFNYHGQRFIFDPNRIFSKEGIAITLQKFGKSSPAAVELISPFGEFIYNLIPDTTSCVIALHNNTHGGYSVKSYLPGGEMETDAKDVFYNPNLDADNFCLTTDSLLFNQLKEYQFNCILQDNLNARKDGSLSVRFGEMNRRYVNVETEDGEVEFYIIMLEKIVERL